MTETRTYRHRAEYLKMAVARRRKQLKQKALIYKGSKCCICGYNKYEGALEFHHLEPDKKDFSLSVRGLTRSWERIVVELDKCILVCANCHRELHADSSAASKRKFEVKTGRIAGTPTSNMAGQSAAEPHLIAKSNEEGSETRA